MDRWEDMVHTSVVRSRSDFAAFLDILKDTDRKPLVVVSIAEGADHPSVDVAALVQQLEDSVHLFVLPSEVTFWLTDALGSKTLSVHSGWVRVYPSMPEWLDKPQLAPNFPPAPAGARRAVERIVEAALNAAFTGGHVSRETAPIAGVSTVATVRHVISAMQAIVEDTAGHQAVLRTNSLVAGLPAERVVAAGQRLAGVFTPMGLLGEFVAEIPSDDPQARVVEYIGDGVVTLALAAGVSADRVRLLLHPAVQIEVVGTAGQDLTTEVTEGEVVTVEVVVIDGDLVAGFSEEQPQDAIAVLPGGPPWILPEASSPAPALADVQASEYETEASAPAAQSDGALVAEVARLGDALDVAEETIKQLRRQVRRTRRFSVPVVHSEPEEQFRLEVWPQITSWFGPPTARSR